MTALRSVSLLAIPAKPHSPLGSRPRAQLSETPACSLLVYLVASLAQQLHIPVDIAKPSLANVLDPSFNAGLVAATRSVVPTQGVELEASAGPISRRLPLPAQLRRQLAFSTAPCTTWDRPNFASEFLYREFPLRRLRDAGKKAINQAVQGDRTVLARCGALNPKGCRWSMDRAQHQHVAEFRRVPGLV